MPKGQYKPLTLQEELLIKRDYLKKPVKTIAAEINVSGGRIMRFLKRNGLEIPKEIIEKRIQESRFKSGSTPFNKGKKQSEFMSVEGIESSKRTRFAKGHIPHNTKKTGNGTISIREDSSGKIYKFIRLKKGVWEQYHRVLWEKVNGKIPDDHIVVFKDNNTLNVTIENLELISRTENMYRNSRHNYPDEIIPSLVLTRKIEQKLNTLKNG